jgi:hypothetical protein
MSDDPPRRWPDDSPEEDAEAHRQRELARLERWIAEQRVKPLTDALESHGLQRGDAAESIAGPIVVPDWWDGIPEPGDCCPWCQRPGTATIPCDQCRAAREQNDDPASLWAWWASLAPPRRRLFLAARWRHDPWTGRPARIEIEWTDVNSDDEIATARLPFCPVTPSTAWDDLAEPGELR